MGQNQPQWLNDAIFYEIYPQSFNDTNGDGIGDFQGIIQKLDYVKSLGCNALWINPCFLSPFGDAGYDVEDYYQAAPRYGTNEDLRELFSEAHKRGIHVLLDLVPGHTSVRHKWFIESMKPEQNEFSDRYIWTGNIWEKPDDLDCLRGISDRNGCCALNFFAHQPALNYGYANPDPEKKWQQSPDSPAPRATVAAMEDVMRFWLGMGCDGFRVDMAGTLVKGDPDGSANIKLWQGIRAFLDAEFPEAAIISEWGEPDKSLAGGFHMDFLLHFGPSHYNDLFRCEHPFFAKDGKGDAYEFVKTYKANRAKAPDGLICIPSGNHDMSRLSLDVDAENLPIAFMFLLSMPGAPFIYYGDEIGMRYVQGLHSVEGGYERTGSRSPMQWDFSTNAGFSSAPAEKLYIPMDSSSDRPNVEAQKADEGSLLNEVRRIIAVRREHSALGNLGGIEFIYCEKNEYPLAYVRSSADEKVLVVINPAAREVGFDSDLEIGGKIYAIGGEIKSENGKITVPPQSAGFYAIR